MYKDIVSIAKNYKTDGVQEEYWLGHRINHGTHYRKNLVILGNMALQAMRKIKVNEELFWDYNNCPYSKNWNLLYTKNSSVTVHCMKCNLPSKKYCKKCKKYMFIDCYDDSQIYQKE